MARMEGNYTVQHQDLGQFDYVAPAPRMRLYETKQSQRFPEQQKAIDWLTRRARHDFIYRW